MPANPARRALRILHVVDSLERGGLERVVVDLAVGQQARGDAVTLFSLMHTNGLRQEVEAAGVEVVVGGKSRAFDVSLIRRLRATARRVGAQVVHAHNFVPNYYAATALLPFPGDGVQVATCHDMGTRLSDRKLRLLFRGSLLRTRKVAMVSAQVHDHHVGTGMVARDKAATILNGIPIERFRPSEGRRASARDTLGLAHDALVIGAVGRLVPVKNHALLIDLLPRLLLRHPRVRLVLVGGGVLEPQLRQRAAELDVSASVSFLGERDAVADILPAFDVYALPSLSEGLSISLLEASSSALPAVAFDVGGNGEVIEHGATGLLVPAGDDDGYCRALESLLDDAQARIRLGNAASGRAARHMSLDAMCGSYDALYRDALGLSPG